jgi:magnesium-protoporphyrin O-methyltransferase
VTEQLARRGAHVIAADISPSLVAIARNRLPVDLRGRVRFHCGDMLDPALGDFDHVVAMDSLIYYSQRDILSALQSLGGRTRERFVFTIAPRTPLLMAMWRLGQLFPRQDRSPTMVPHAPAALARGLQGTEAHRLCQLQRVTSGFYISQAMELAPC